MTTDDDGNENGDAQDARVSFNVRCDALADSLCLGSASPCVSLFLAVAHPPASELVRAYEVFRSKVVVEFENVHGISSKSHFLIYQPFALHATVVTLVPIAEPDLEENRESFAEWDRVIHSAQNLPDWPEHGSVQIVGAHLDINGGGYLVVEDVDGCIERLRKCLGTAAKSSSRPADASLLRFPRIYHMTCFRWRKVEDGHISKATFEKLASCFARAWSDGPVKVPCGDVALISERLPYMFDAGVEKTFSLR